MRFETLSALVLTSALGLFAVGCSAPSTNYDAGTPAPDVQFQWLNDADGAASLSEMRGRVVLLDFWRTW